jgi:hypothetical protein
MAEQFVWMVMANPYFAIVFGLKFIGPNFGI